MAQETSGWERFFEMIQSQHILVRSIAWVVVFLAAMTLAHPTWADRIAEPDQLAVFIMGIALLFGIAMANLTGRRPLPEKIEANEFILRDTHGRTRGRWGFSKKWEDAHWLLFPSFTLNDLEGNERVRLSVLADNPALIMTGKDGKERMGMDLTWDEPRLRLLDADGKVRTVLGLTKDGPGLSILDADETPRATLELTANGSRLRLLDADETQRATLGMDENGPSLVLRDYVGDPVAALDVSKDGTKLVLGDTENENVFLGLTKDGPKLSLRSVCFDSISLDVKVNESRLAMCDVSGSARVLLGVEKQRMFPEFLPSGEPNPEGSKKDASLVPALKLYNEEGKEQAKLAVAWNESILSLKSSNGKQQTLLGVIEEGFFDSKEGPALNMYDREGKMRVWLGVDEDEPGMTLFNEAQEALWSVP